jgi:predicted alpha/beta hydrolase
MHAVDLRCQWIVREAATHRRQARFTDVACRDLSLRIDLGQDRRFAAGRSAAVQNT